MPTTPEQDLITKARSFDLDALAEIYDTYNLRIYRYSYRLLGDDNLAEECVAETFSRLLLAFKGGGGPKDHLQAYLYRIAHNWITDKYRRQPLPELSLEDCVIVDKDNPAEEAMDHILLGQIRSALTRVTPEQRLVVISKYVEGLDNEEIAQIIGKPVGAIKALQHRALQSLRRLLQPME
jgi:RNA polymerase sigma-70 factor, ECF subfamily